ncbi:hypothetical protein Mal64_17700 [Pseudobythopirellula maris]|uniref:Uncharacterized protein n=1 Tax=Pseudobythopirellula maris TaxID=2527991 RepID=A0A5C5ZN71_9BACT|nr:hypothetical protein Mal64_17700 [Pseudobythopirellula maris]
MKSGVYELAEWCDFSCCVVDVQYPRTVEYWTGAFSPNDLAQVIHDAP